MQHPFIVAFKSKAYLANQEMLLELECPHYLMVSSFVRMTDSTIKSQNSCFFSMFFFMNANLPILGSKIILVYSSPKIMCFEGFLYVNFIFPSYKFQYQKEA